ncbi:unnamed protein product [Alternaria alternata]
MRTPGVLIPADSFAYVQDESLRDILNTTLGVWESPNQHYRSLTQSKFEGILVLNLPFRTDRRDAMSLSAAASNIKLEFVEGVTVDHNLTTALIFEDDVDWDIRIRQNLQRFALASRFLSGNHGISTVKDKLETHTNTETEDTAFKIIDTSNLPKTLTSLPLSSIPSYSSNPHISPYGDPTQWDILWLGHCGTGMPRPALSPHIPINHRHSTTTTILTQPNDFTVPSAQHLKAHPFQGDPDALATPSPNAAPDASSINLA